VLLVQLQPALLAGRGRSSDADPVKVLTAIVEWWQAVQGGELARFFGSQADQGLPGNQR
jgi:hypothetical protein